VFGRGGHPSRPIDSHSRTRKNSIFSFTFLALLSLLLHCWAITLGTLSVQAPKLAGAIVRTSTFGPPLSGAIKRNRGWQATHKPLTFGNRHYLGGYCRPRGAILDCGPQRHGLTTQIQTAPARRSIVPWENPSMSQSMSRNRRKGEDRRKNNSLEYNYVCRRKNPERRKRQYGICRYQWWPPVEERKKAS
jgi:hypothetical protein